MFFEPPRSLVGDFNQWNEATTPMSRDAFGTWEVCKKLCGFFFSDIIFEDWKCGFKFI